MTPTRRLLPWLGLAAALGLATMPAWRVMWAGANPSLDELLALRCAPP